MPTAISVRFLFLEPLMLQTLAARGHAAEELMDCDSEARVKGAPISLSSGMVSFDWPARLVLGLLESLAYGLRACTELLQKSSDIARQKEGGELGHQLVPWINHVMRPLVRRRVASDVASSEIHLHPAFTSLLHHLGHLPSDDQQSLSQNIANRPALIFVPTMLR